MKVALVQQDIVWASPADNCSRLDVLLKTAEGCDLCVLPEMFSTGFATRPDGIAETSPAPSLEWMKAKSAQMNCAIAGSISTFEDGTFYNRFHFVKPDGSVTSYDKHHLFTYSGEDKTFTAGTERRVIEWRGVRFLMIVCYDLRFPVWIRNRKDYDAILCVASWPVARRKAWDTLVRARAIENQCFLAAVNRVGSDPSCQYSGGTAFIDPYGETQCFVEDGKEGICIADLDMSGLDAFRAKFPVLNDADEFRMI